MSDDDRRGVGSSGTEEVSAVRQEEELVLGKTTKEMGSVRARKRVDNERVERVVPREIEYSEGVDHASPNVDDSGQVETLPDGSVSIPVFEEEIVITKRLVVRERVVIRKRTVTEEHRVEADVRRERVEIEADPEVELTDAESSSRPSESSGHREEPLHP
jgi:uncharacterized protein (TIGR02271 family)